MLYKLDLGIDHVLIDEAQDTSPQQWKIVKTICSEFCPAARAQNVRRTIFAVGDEKQSIFSFQGAAPAAFDEMRHFFERLFTTAEMRLALFAFPSLVPLRRERARLVDQVFAERERLHERDDGRGGIPQHGRCPMPRRVWSKSGIWKRRTRTSA